MSHGHADLRRQVRPGPARTATSRGGAARLAPQHAAALRLQRTVGNRGVAAIARASRRSWTAPLIQRVKFRANPPGTYPLARERQRLQLDPESLEADLPDAQYNFVAMDGTIWVSRTSGHPALAAGEDVDYAGMLLIRDGALAEWNNHSGHYQPTADEKGQAGLPIHLFTTWQQYEADGGWQCMKRALIAVEKPVRSFSGVPILVGDQSGYQPLGEAEGSSAKCPTCVIL